MQSRPTLARSLGLLALLLVVVAVGIVTAGRATPGGPEAATTGSASTTITSSAATASRPTTSASGTRASSGASSSAVSASATAGGSSLPSFAHVFLIVMENKEYGSIVGNRDAPFINDLIDRYGLATNYTAVAHPSQPNYIALFSGSTFGIHDDGKHDLDGRNLADQLEQHGRTWRVFAQNVPGGCSKTGKQSGGVDLVGEPGEYARKHEPAISFVDISRDPARCAAITNLAAFDPAAADFELIVPNQTNDMHDASVATGDAFLRAFVPRITDSPAFRNSLLILTWDEGTSGAGGGGRVATVLVSPLVKAGTRSDTPHTHYSTLRTIENAWDLGCLEESCSANDFREFFRS